MLSTPLRTVPRAHGPALARAFSASASASKKKDVLKVQFTPWPTKEKFKLKEAVRVLRALEIGAPTSRFDLELITKVPKQGHNLRGQVVLPTDPRKGVREEVLVVFAESDSLSERLAKEIPGIIVGQQELCEPILSGKLKPTRVFATPGMLPTVTAQLARFLGPKMLMPTVKRGTVGEGRKLVDLIGDSGSRIDWAANDLGIIRFGIAKIGWSNEAIEENIRAFITHVEKLTLGQGEIIDMTSRKKTNSSIARIRLETTQGPSIEIEGSDL